MDVMTTSEVQGVQEVYKIAPPGSLLVSTDGDLPWRFQAFEQYEYVSQTDAILLGTPHDLAILMRQEDRPRAYLILTASEQAAAELFSGLSQATWDSFVEQLRASPEFQLVYENADTKIFELLPQTATTSASIASDTTAVASFSDGTQLRRKASLS
jgi:hypothetical protein